MTAHDTHSARLHALTAALCALLLLVALGILDAEGAPWWALLGVQGALLVSAASAGIWLDRSVAFGVRRSAFGRGGQEDGRRGDEASREWGPADPLWWAELERAQQARQRRMRAGFTLPRDDDDVFWQERLNKEDEG